MHVLLVPVGSHGDVHPFLGLGQALRARGHRVTFLINEYFGPLVRGLGFEMAAVGGAELFEAAMRRPDLWHPTRGFAAVAPGIVDGARLAFDLIRERYVPGEAVAVGGTLAFGVRLAEEALGVPGATVHLQPAVMHSNHDTPIYGGADTRRWPRWIKRPFFDLVYARLIEPHIRPGLNDYRRGLGLPPVADVMRRWIHSPRLVLGFFPAWFGPPQPDWPGSTRLVGFPLYDEADVTPIAPELEDFLGAGPPPIAFTPGSANLTGRAFFEAAAEACVRLGRRGLLLTRHADQVPSALPEGVRHVDYAPFSRLLPRVAALVHHGGVGTSAQGMAAGIPHLVMPLAHDQFDNAARMERLGIARWIWPKRFRGPAVADALRRLTEDPGVAESCRRVVARFADDPSPMDRASIAIESLLAAPVP